MHQISIYLKTQCLKKQSHDRPSEIIVVKSSLSTCRPTALFLSTRQSEQPQCLLNSRSVSKLQTPISPHKQSETFQEKIAMARLQDILRCWGSANPRHILNRGPFHKTDNGAQYQYTKTALPIF